MNEREAKLLVVKHVLLEVFGMIVCVGLMVGGFLGILWLCSLLGA